MDTTQLKQSARQRLGRAVIAMVVSLTVGFILLDTVVPGLAEREGLWLKIPLALVLTLASLEGLVQGFMWGSQEGRAWKERFSAAELRNLVVAFVLVGVLVLGWVRSVVMVVLIGVVLLFGLSLGWLLGRSGKMPEDHEV